MSHNYHFCTMPRSPIAGSPLRRQAIVWVAVLIRASKDAGLGGHLKSNPQTRNGPDATKKH
jgi:hypothetical protein